MQYSYNINQRTLLSPIVSTICHNKVMQYNMMVLNGDVIWVSEILTSGDSETPGASSGSSLSAHEHISVLSAYVPQHLFVCV